MRLKNELIKEMSSIKIVKESEPTIWQIECQEEVITASLSDGRVISIPKAWYQPFREATRQQLTNYEILPQGKGIYFSELDEYLPVEAFTHGLGSSCC